MTFHIANGLGDSLDAPSYEEMARFLAEIDASDIEHGAAWLTTNDGRSLEWNGDGRLVLSDDKNRPGHHLLAVSRARALELWIALAEGRVDDVQREAWQPGLGVVRDLEREEEQRSWQLREDRAFFDALGDERADVRCRHYGCASGAVSLSVLCRVHHFESVRRHPWPFSV